MSQALILYGAAGAGKGTVSQKIQLLSSGVVTPICTGDYFRKKSEHQATAAEGTLVEHRHVMDFFRQGIKDCGRRPVIIDSPRTPQQAVDLTNLLRDSGYKAVVSAFIDTAFEKCLQRLRERAEREKRVDDLDPAVVRRRFDIFQTESPVVIPVLEECTDRHFTVDGNRSKADVEQEAMSIGQRLFPSVARRVAQCLLS